MKIKRVLIVTDSLGSPRSTPETVLYEQSWVYQVKCFLEKRGYDVFSITHNGLSSAELLDLAHTKLALYAPEITIIQCGIVDCSPRVLKRREILLCRVLGIGGFIHKFAHKHHALLSNWRKLTLYTEAQYEEHIRAVYKTLSEDAKSHVMQIPIAPACSGYIKNAPRIEKNIRTYNAIIARYADSVLSDFSLIDKDVVDSIFMEDHHHLNRAGHNLLAGIVEKSLLDFFDKNKGR